MLQVCLGFSVCGYFLLQQNCPCNFPGVFSCQKCQISTFNGLSSVANRSEKDKEGQEAAGSVANAKGISMGVAVKTFWIYSLTAFAAFLVVFCFFFEIVLTESGDTRHSAASHASC